MDMAYWPPPYFSGLDSEVGGRRGDLAPRPGSPLPSTRKPTEVEWRFTEAGERVRVSTRSGRIIPKPQFPRADGIVPETWTGEAGRGPGRWAGLGVGVLGSPPHLLFSGSTDGPKDTSVEDALERTYVPRLKTLEEEVMEAMGIQETRRHRKVYWY